MDDESIERCFNQHDTDGSGCVNKSEIEKLCTELGLPEERQAAICQAIMEADLNKDGKVTLEEFKKYVRG